MKNTKTTNKVIKPKIHTVKFWTYIRDNGDGSSSSLQFSSEELAEKMARKDFKNFGMRMCDDVFEDSIQVTDDFKFVDSKELLEELEEDEDEG